MCRRVTGPWGTHAVVERSAVRKASYRAGFPASCLVVLVVVAVLVSANRSLAQTGDVVISLDTTWTAGQYTLNSLTVTNGATLTLQGANTGGQVGGQWQGYGVTITAGTVQVDAGSRISADAQGYWTGQGPGGSGSYSIGGTYGGQGSDNPAAPYGSALAPTDLGSAGGGWYGGWSGGGGAIRLIVAGALTNNGTISANGQSAGGNNGGAAGGSIYVTTGTLAGSGTFTANGNQGSNASGGGGRIAIYYTVNGGFNPASVTASAGGSRASVGTAYLLENSTNLYVTSNLLLPADTVASYANITVSNGALLSLGGGSSITVSGNLTVTGDSTLLVQSKNNGGQVGGVWQGVGSTITAGTVQVDAGSRISADAQGYWTGQGPGGSVSYSIGGTYGGQGSDNPAAPYGSALAPTDLGSAGGGAYGGWSAGGGAIRLIVAGALTNNGTISANGQSAGGNNGGAAGGSIYVTTGTLAGSGTFTANGNQGSNASGGGGRIAIYYNVDGGFVGVGTITANAPAGAQAGSVNLIQYFHLTVAKAGNGAGTVTSSPAGLDCGTACATTFNSGTPVLLTATQATGSAFSGWSGDTDCADGTVAMTADRSCTATFTLLTFPLTVTKTGSGSVTADPPGIDCGATCAADYNYNTLVTLTATPTPGARFLGWSGEGCSGTGTCAVTVTQPRAVTAPFAWNPHAVGAFRPSDGTFYLDYNGNGVWDGCGTDRCLSVGMLGDIPLAGDWNGTGTSKVGAFRPSDGTFYLDYNGNGQWDGCGTDRCLQIGMNGDIPLVGDWDGTTFAKVGVFRPADGTFYLDYNGNGAWDGCGTDRCLQIGMTGDIPLVGDWDGTLFAKVGVFRPADGFFYLDYNGNGIWDGCGTDRCLAIGLAGDLPFVGDWDGSGSGKVGLFRPSDGTFYLDYNGNGQWDGCGADRCLSIGLAGDTPLIGDWDGTGFAKVGVFRPSDGTFYLDYNGSGTWEGCGTDRCLSIGMDGDTPLVGKW